MKSQIITASFRLSRFSPGKELTLFLRRSRSLPKAGRCLSRLFRTTLYYNTTVVRLQYFDGNGYSHYRLVHESPSSVGTLGGTEIKYVKTFEYVNGTKIKVTGNGNTTLSLNVTTNQNRTFNYTQSAFVNGTHTFIVPYSTNWTSYGMKTGNAYNVTVGNSTKSIAVSESDVTQWKRA